MVSWHANAKKPGFCWRNPCGGSKSSQPKVFLVNSTNLPSPRFRELTSYFDWSAVVAHGSCLREDVVGLSTEVFVQGRDRVAKQFFFGPGSLLWPGPHRDVDYYGRDCALRILYVYAFCAFCKCSDEARHLPQTRDASYLDGAHFQFPCAWRACPHMLNANPGLKSLILWHGHLPTVWRAKWYLFSWQKCIASVYPHCIYIFDLYHINSYHIISMYNHCIKNK